MSTNHLETRGKC